MQKVSVNPYIIKENEKITITEEGEKYLSNILSDAKGDIYVFNEKASPLMVAAAMARLSRRSSDLREIYLDEFAATGGDKAE